ncbi:hypothetical protein COCMIDRAFT_103623, partial [Bipolaris oryzae ATCC 44560]
LRKVYITDCVVEFAFLFLERCKMSQALHSLFRLLAFFFLSFTLLPKRRTLLICETSY